MKRTLEFLLVSLFVSGTLSAAVNELVTVIGGPVSGAAGRDPSIAAFKGIPFAAPPVGDLRWRAPQPGSPEKFTSWESSDRVNH